MKRPGGFDGGEARPEPVAPARVPVSNPAPAPSLWQHRNLHMSPLRCSPKPLISPRCARGILRELRRPRVLTVCSLPKIA